MNVARNDYYIYLIIYIQVAVFPTHLTLSDRHLNKFHTKFVLHIHEKITPFLWFNNQVEEAARFYVSVFKNSEIIYVNHMMVIFELDERELYALSRACKPARLPKGFVFLLQAHQITYYGSSIN